MFCAAIPAAAAVGAAANSKQKKKQAETGKKASLPAGPLTGLVIVGLLAGSVTVHSQLNG
jgi:hypothetical protein